jgi:predicted  nucleic acid-binding Zn-ribbon protein
MNQTLSLYRLQQIDSQLDHLQARLQQIQKSLDDDVELRRLKEQAGEADARCITAENTLEKAEKDVQNQIIKIEQTQSSLYGSKIHSPKELQDLQNDVISLKRFLVILEDRQINAMQESETAEEIQQVAHAKLRAALDDQAEINKGLHQEQTTINNELERFFAERNAVSGAIPVEELGLYHQLRQQRRGVAVTIISDNSCGACGNSLSLAQIQSARSSGHMTLCPSCGRILYGS